MWLFSSEHRSRGGDVGGHHSRFDNGDDRDVLCRFASLRREGRIAGIRWCGRLRSKRDQGGRRLGGRGLERRRSSRGPEDTKVKRPTPNAQHSKRNTQHPTPNTQNATPKTQEVVFDLLVGTWMRCAAAHGIAHNVDVLSAEEAEESDALHFVWLTKQLRSRGVCGSKSLPFEKEAKLVGGALEFGGLVVHRPAGLRRFLQLEGDALASGAVEESEIWRVSVGFGGGVRGRVAVLVGHGAFLSLSVTLCG